MKYITDERFIVHSNTKEAMANYRDNYDRIFGDAPGSSQDVEARQVAPAPDAAADSDAIECRVKMYANIDRDRPVARFPATPPDEDCDVCGALAGEWCKDACSEAPRPCTAAECSGGYYEGVDNDGQPIGYTCTEQDGCGLPGCPSRT